MASNHPNFLSHYTTLSGLMGIITDKSIWASNVSMLNDKSELLHGLNVATEALLAVSEEPELKIYNKIIEKIDKDLASGKLPSFYAVCFCSDKDNLSQWRGYGGSVQGVCLNFDFQSLRRFFRKSNADLVKVIYSHKSTTKKLKLEIIKQLTRDLDWKEIIGWKDDDEMYMGMFDTVSRIMPRFKHLGFVNEKEWRAVAHFKQDDRGLNFRADGNKIVPYISMKFDNTPIPLKSVSVGPGHDQELTVRSIKIFLEGKGLHDVPVETSKIPYRPSVR